jgi:hypothetical protein
MAFPSYAQLQSCSLINSSYQLNSNFQTIAKYNYKLAILLSIQLPHKQSKTQTPSIKIKTSNQICTQHNITLSLNVKAYEPNSVKNIHKPLIKCINIET